MMRPFAVILFLTGALLLAPAAPLASGATTPFGPKYCTSGAAAGQCDVPRGVAVNPIDGHVFVADQVNRRINEFTAWGEFVKSWGWGVRNGSSELQTCTTESGCQQGLQGSGAGQFSRALGLAIDSAGDIYAVDSLNFRVQKFDPEGNFLLMFGGGVNEGPNHPGDVCTAQHIAEGDTCGAGISGTGDGQFSSEWLYTQPSYIATGPEDQVYVGDVERIQEFDSDGSFVRVVPDPDQVLQGSGLPVGEIAVDPLSGDLYVAYLNGRESFDRSLPNVFRLDESTGALLDTLAVENPSALATDTNGNVYAFDQRVSDNFEPANSHSTRILKFNSSGEPLETIAETKPTASDEIETSTGVGTGSFCFGAGESGLYVSVKNVISFGKPVLDYVQAYGPTPDPAKCPPPQVPPEINAQFATAVDVESAVLRAEINPRYFTATAGTTTFYVQWGTDACVKESGWEAPCVRAQPGPPGIPLKSEPVDEDLTTPGVLLSGLEPHTTYRYRFVAEGSGKPGEPIVGRGGEPGVDGDDASFTTFLAPEAPAVCPNDPMRLGAGAKLPDCRAYELVSPVDKSGGDASVRLNLAGFPARMDQSAISGDSLAYSSYRPFGEVESAPFSSQYLAHRDPQSGWQSESISPPQTSDAFAELLQVDNLYRAFSPDLATSWVLTDTDPVLGPGGVEGFPNIYRRDNAAGSYSACTAAEPEFPENASGHGPELQGFSADQQLAVFRYRNKLTEDASSQLIEGRPINQLYVCSYGEGGEEAQLRLLSVLPNGSASELENTVGIANTDFQGDQGRTGTLANAVSADGSRVFWTASTTNDANTPGTLYLRLNPTEEQSALSPGGKCTEAEKACTLQVAPSPARYWTAAKDGSLAIYGKDEGSSGETLFEYDVESRKSTQIATQAMGVLGASDDASRVYFVSKESFDGAQAGEPNLYLYEADEEGAPTITFIAGFSERDARLDNLGFTSAHPWPVRHTSSVSPDGSTVAFTSNNPELAEAAGYDNTDQASGEPDGEVYRYEAGSGELACISCNPSGSRPFGREVQGTSNSGTIAQWAASRLPTWLNSLYAPRALSEDGNRIFFEAFGPLVLSDTNGKADVYQWEAEGTGDCEEGDSAYVDSSGGCLTLISSGKSTSDSEFVDASPEGDDVFIRTAESLLSWDPGSVDIYDARVNGGFAPPPARKPQCEGQSCQGQAKASNDSTPSSLTFRGPGNEKSKPTKPRRCGPAKRKVRKGGKTRCVRKRQRGSRGSAAR